ncbi:nitroreductase [Rhodovulum sp. BSW8]|uniref:Putative NAD(P)H nitroreductase n=1 Tax=Rhodovulum visakhapatnamense TaxID=364297 RepID=A0A4V3GU73_9RHOB|nr:MULTISPECIES: nitroreductase family protein [Rhodovulum]RBO51568.1 nitroreductase [Rhodovulum sp. BSW8]TDX29628.1 nitroreductase [Rhodovulum visakhapatnamense]
MPDPRPEVLDFLLTRRSRPAKTLAEPGPTRDALIPILTAAARSPDHGKLEPWRFIVLEKPALTRLEALVRTRGAALGQPEEAIAKAASAYAQSPLAVVVVSAPKPSSKVPEIEQIHSAGAVCLALLNAALASGWGANWLTGWPAHDRGFLAEGLGLAETETVAGIVHIGTETAAPPDRPRPDITAITEWVSE